MMNNKSPEYVEIPRGVEKYGIMIFVAGTKRYISGKGELKGREGKTLYINVMIGSD